MTPLGVLFVHPHPDDEAIACGGAIARYVDEGLRVKVVTCTGGEEGSNLAGIDLGGRDMPEVRRQELADALAVLGVQDHELLGYRDSGMAGEEANDHPDSFHRAELDEAAARLARIIRAFRPQVVVSDDEQGGYGHPDHVKANRVTARAVALAGDDGAGLSTSARSSTPPAPTSLDGPEPWRVAKRYVHALPRSRMLAAHNLLLELGYDSPWGEQPLEDPSALPFGVEDAEVTTHLDVLAWLDRKWEALRQHRSQVAEDSFFFNLPDELGERFFGSEAYVLRAGTPAGRPEDDLLAGLR